MNGRNGSTAVSSPSSTSGELSLPFAASEGRGRRTQNESKKRGRGWTRGRTTDRSRNGNRVFGRSLGSGRNRRGRRRNRTVLMLSVQ